MEELINLVSKKVGITPEQAKTAITTIVKFLKEKLPEPIGNQIDGVISGEGLGDIAGKIGGLFGN